MSGTSSRCRGKRERDPGRDGEQFIPMPMVTLRSERFSALSPKAVKLLLDIAAQWNGLNNGDLSATLSVLKNRGWGSATTLARALDELLVAGFIARTRFGNRHRCALFGLTWLALSRSDKLQNKLDADLVRGFRRGAYLDRNYTAVAPTKAPVMARRKKNGATESGTPDSGLLQKVEHQIANSSLELQKVEQSEGFLETWTPFSGHLI
jgi:hypothetical protein